LDPITGILTYTANDIDGVFVDTITVLATNELNEVDLFIVIITITDVMESITPDTIYVVVETGMTELDIEFQGNQLTGTVTYELAPEDATGMSDYGTWVLNPDGSFDYTANIITGSFVDTIIVIASNGINADTSYIIISIEEICDAPITTIQSDGCDDCTDVCLEIPMDNLSDYIITSYGVTVPQSDFLACDIDTLINYTYFSLLGGGQQGPYELLSWTVNGNMYTGTFQNPQGLVDLMNTNDPSGNWTLLPNSLSIVGGNPSINYGIMLVDNLAGLNLPPSEIGSNVGFVAMGSGLCVSSDENHVLEIFEVAGSQTCPIEVINVLIGDECIDPAIVEVTFTTNTENNEVCFDGLQLIGANITYTLGTDAASTAPGNAGNNWTTPNANGCIEFDAGSVAGVDVETIIVIANNGTQLDTTIIIVSLIDPVDPVINFDTTFVTIEVNMDSTICFSGLDLTGGITYELQSGGTAGTSTFGDWTLDDATGEACVTYDAGSTEGMFVDEITVIATDADSNIDQWTVIVSITNNCDPIDPTIVETESCDDCTTVCLGIPFEDINDFVVSLDGTPLANTDFIGCQYDAIKAYSYITLLGAGAIGPYELDTWTVNGQTFSGSFADPQGLADLMNQLDPAGNWVLDATIFSIMGGQEGATYSEMTVTNLAALASTSVMPLNTIVVGMGTAVCVPPGDHEVIVLDTATACPVQIIQTTDIGCVIDADTFEITIDLGATSNVECFTDLDILSDVTYTLESGTLGNVVGTGNAGTWTLNPTTGCIEYVSDGTVDGQSVDTVCIYAINDLDGTLEDTTCIIVNIIPDTVIECTTTIIPVDMLVGTSLTELIPNEGCLEDVDTIYNACPELSGTFASVTNIELADESVTFFGDSIGCDTVCIVAMDNTTGATDTTIYVVCVEPCGASNTIFDTLLVGTVENYLVAVDACIENPDTIYNDCADEFNELIDVTLSATAPYTIDVNPTIVGMDTACIIVCDNNVGVCDTTIYIFTIEPCNDIDTIVEILTIGEAPSIINLGDVSCVTDADTIINDCTALSGTFATVELVGLDMTLTPVMAGTSDTACMIIGNTMTNEYDTIIYIIDVLESDCITDTIELTIPAGTLLAEMVSDSGCLENVDTIYNGCDDITAQYASITDINIATQTVTFSGDTPGASDTVCIVLQDTITGETDTTIYIIDVTCGAIDTIYDTLTLGINYDPFLAAVATCIENPDSISNDCTTASGDLVTVTIDETGLMVDFDPIAVGSADTACIVVCDTNLGVCDTTIYILTVEPCAGIDTLYETLTVGDAPSFYSIIDSTCVANPDTIFNYCTAASGTFANVTLDTIGLTMELEPVMEGASDTACIVIGNTITGEYDTTIYIINVLDDCIDTVFVTVPLGQLQTEVIPVSANCIDNVDTLYNDCTGLIGDYASIDNIDTLGLNITFSGDTIGASDTVCIVMVDTITLDTYTVIYVIDVAPECEDIFTVDSINLQVSDCTDNIELCVDIELENVFGYTITDNGMPYAGMYGGCDFDTLISYSYVTLFNSGDSGPYMLNNWTVNGDVYTGMFQTVQNLVDSMNVWNPAGDWMLDATMFQIAGGISSDVYGDMDVLHTATGTSSVLGVGSIMPANGATLDFSVGIHEVIITDTLTGCADTLDVNVFCIPTYVHYDTVQIGEMDTFCLGAVLDLPGNIIEATIFDDCSGSNGTEVDFVINADGDTCVVYTGLEIGMDTACIVVCDDMGLCDTTTIIVTVLISSCTDTVMLELAVGATIDTLIDATACVSEFDTIFNDCTDLSIENNATIVNLDTTSVGGTVSYEGMTVGMDTFCIVICDTLADGTTAACDTTIFLVNVIEPVSCLDTIFDTISVAQIVNFDIDATSCISEFDTIYNYCEDMSFDGSIVINDLDTTMIGGTISYEGVEIGTDTFCIVVCDTLLDGTIAACDTTIFIVTVEAEECIGDSTGIDIVLEVGVTLTDTLPLSSCIVSMDIIYNDCDMLSGVFAEVDEYITDTTLVDITGLTVGVDTACIIVCDTTTTPGVWVCDTITYVITVLENCVAPVAVNDTIGTVLNIDVTYDVLENDTILDTMDCPIIDPIVTVVDPPMNGTVDVDMDGSIIYTPDTDFCGEMDSFTYMVMNTEGVDVATVYVDVRCDEILVFNGFSPNDDGVNDIFFIDGLENFPENNLYIFNRWGNQVYLVDDYQNDWNGTWDGKPLPDGTYFYVLSYMARDENNEDIRRQINGYVQIRR
jgi:gliding motility-associated-like protein